MGLPAGISRRSGASSEGAWTGRRAKKRPGPRQRFREALVSLRTFRNARRRGRCTRAGFPKRAPSRDVAHALDFSGTRAVAECWNAGYSRPGRRFRGAAIGIPFPLFCRKNRILILTQIPLFNKIFLFPARKQGKFSQTAGAHPPPFRAPFHAMPLIFIF